MSVHVVLQDLHYHTPKAAIEETTPSSGLGYSKGRQWEMAGGLGPNCLPRWRALGAQIEFSCEGITSVIKGLQKSA